MDQSGFGIDDKLLTDLDFADDIALAREKDCVSQEMTTSSLQCKVQPTH